MVKYILSILLFVSAITFANVDNYSLKLDEFTLATSNTGLNDTIDVTKAAWESSDSLHLSIYNCGKSYDGMKCKLLGRSTENRLFEMYFNNKGMAIQFSISTKRIDLSKVNFVALTMGLAPTDNRMGFNYRMGFLRFI